MGPYGVGPAGPPGPPGPAGPQGPPGSSSVRIYEVSSFDLTQASSLNAGNVSHYPVIALDPGISTVITSFTNMGNGTNQVTLDTSLMTTPSTNVLGTVIISNNGLLTIVGTTTAVGTKSFRLNFTFPPGLNGLGMLSLRFL
jgi:hypothetical protein